MTHRPAIALFAAGLLTACATPQEPLTPTQQVMPQVRPGADESQLAPHGALSPTQASALGALVLRWRDGGEGPIIIQAPAAGPGAGTGAAVAAELARLGVSPAAIRAMPYDSPDPAPVRVGYSRFEAVVANCANLWGDAVMTAENRPMPTFGCSVSSNAAVQTANARDLVAATPADTADSRRRVSQLNSYNEGKQPQAESQDSNP